MRLSLGCGYSMLEGYENYDIVPVPGGRLVDLGREWPWEDSTVEIVQAQHVFERLPNRAFTLNECWRVLRHDGLLAVNVYTTDGPGAWSNPAHVSYWNRGTFAYCTDGDMHHVLDKRAHGIRACFGVVSEHTVDTEDGPCLLILLRAVKRAVPEGSTVEEEVDDVF